MMCERIGNARGQHGASYCLMPSPASLTTISTTNAIVSKKLRRSSQLLVGSITTLHVSCCGWLTWHSGHTSPNSPKLLVHGMVVQREDHSVEHDEDKDQR